MVKNCLCSIKDTTEELNIPDISLYEFNLRLEPLEIFATPGREIVEDHHLIGAADKPTYEIGADKSCPTGDNTAP